ncbi:MAG: DUF4142 domain-containing protein [Nitrosospira sp.]|nr:DUF4142 domain-containing protein [Nitrosospira sp.]
MKGFVHPVHPIRLVPLAHLLPFVLLVLLLANGLVTPALAALPEARDMDDAQIVDAMITVNGIAIHAGKLAQSRSTSEKIKAHAQQVVARHADVSQSAAELAAKLNLTPRDNSLSRELRADGAKDIARLETLRGEEFDKAFIDQDVVLHQNTLDMIDDRLMPKVRNEELKALLFNLFAPFSEHLEHAQQIQGTLK